MDSFSFITHPAEVGVEGAPFRERMHGGKPDQDGRQAGPVAPVWWPEALRSVPPALLASGLMIAAFMVFTLMAVLMRIAGDRISVPQIILIRQLVAFVLLAPFYWRAREQIRHPTGLRLHLARGVLAVGSMLCGLSAILLIPLVDATAIQMAEVLFVTALAALILKEKVGWRRWTATAVGFVGIFIMLRPFGGGVNLYALLALLGALFGAGSMIAVRLGSTHDRTETVLFWQGVVVVALIAPIALWLWVPPTASEFALLLFMGVVFTLGQWLFTYALRIADASKLAPLQYLRLLMTAVVGWALYGEVPTLATAIGGALVLGAASYTIRRNAKCQSRSGPRRRPEPSALVAQLAADDLAGRGHREVRAECDLAWILMRREPLTHEALNVRDQRVRRSLPLLQHDEGLDDLGAQRIGLAHHRGERHSRMAQQAILDLARPIR